MPIKSTEHEIFSLIETELSLNYAEDSFKMRNFSTDSGFGVRVLNDKKLGFSYCSGEDEVKTTISKAKLLSRHSVESDFSFVPKSSYPHLNTFDEKIAEMDESFLRDMSTQINDLVKKQGCKSRIYSSLSNEQVKLENTCGFFGEYKKTYADFFVEAMYGEGYGYSSYNGCRLPKDIPALADESIQMAKQMKNAKKLETGTYTVVFSVESISSLFEALMPSLSGHWKRKKISTLCDKLGQKIISEKITVHDDPLIELSSCVPFDDEGTKSSKQTIFDKGVLKRFLFDRESAALDHQKSSGFCSRATYSSSPQVGTSNISIDSGNYTRFEDELGDFLFVKSLHGTHTSNTTTGDFGVEISASIYNTNKGKIQSPKRGFIISDNIFNLLNKVIGLEKERQIHADFFSPRIAFSNIKVVS
ncbi:MAG: TldD/PmbA family protein [Candidatus Micrarchaeota archaeon]